LRIVVSLIGEAVAMDAREDAAQNNQARWIMIRFPF
jgi:hypothetical protein